MKLQALNICLILMIFSDSFGQTVSTVTVQPVAPTASDMIVAAVTTQYPGGPCSRESYIKMVQNDTIILNSFYCYQSASGGCTSTDTFALGQLPAGTYVIRAMLSSSNVAAACGSASINLLDIGFGNFTVQTATGVPIINELLTVHPNPASDRIVVTGKINNAEIRIFDITGVLAKRFSLAEGQPLDISDLPESIYFYALKTNERTISGKFVISR